MICDILLIEDDNLVICGEVAIVDFKHVTKSHLLQLDPLLVKKLAVLNQEGSPLKQRGIHYGGMIAPQFNNGIHNAIHYFS